MKEPNRVLRIGIVGVGNIGFVHATCIYRGMIHAAKLCALCDLNGNMESELAEYFPEVPFYTDYRKMLCEEKLDALIVSVPHPKHSSIAIDAFESGLHVLVEKPMDISMSNGKKLCCAAQKSGKKFGIMFNQRTGSLFAKAKEIVESGQLGQLKRSVWIITNWYRTQKYYDSGTWRATWSGEGGGVLVNQAPHQLDLWQWICGMPKRITAFCNEGKYHNIEVEDEATILAQFQNGAEGVFVTSTGEYPGTNRLEIAGTKGKLVLENGVLKWWRLEQDEREVCSASTKAFDEIPMEYLEIPDQPCSYGHQQILQNFTNAVLFDEPLLAPGYDGLKELAIQNAAYLSAWKGNIPVEIPFDEDEYDEFLRKKQEMYTASKECSTLAKHAEYSNRWQINW